MKKTIILLSLVTGVSLRAQIPVTDVANLMNNEVAHLENIAKWVESIEQLKTQITQLKEQVSIQSDLRKWAGNPGSATLALNTLGLNELSQAYGKSKEAILTTTASLESLTSTDKGMYRPLAVLDLGGEEMKYDENTFRRYSILDAKKANAEEVAETTGERVRVLQEEVGTTLLSLNAASTEAETQKEAAKLTALNGQLAQVETERKRKVDEVLLQKISNDARLEEERLAAAQAEAKDAYIANQKASDYFGKIHLKKVSP